MKILKDLFWTVLVAALLAQVAIFAASRLSLTDAIRPEQRPVFVLGIILFSLVFRLLIHVREGSK